MNWFTGFVAFTVIWWVVFFAVLPFGVRTAEEAGLAVEEGHASSAPVAPRIGLKMLITTGLSAVLFACFYYVVAVDLIGFRELMR